MDSDVHRSRHLAVVTAICTVLTLVVACSTSSEGKGNDSGEPEAGNCTSPGGPVAGAQDMHCDSDAGPTVQVVDLAACTGAAPSSDASAGGGDDGGAECHGQGNGSDEQPAGAGQSAQLRPLGTQRRGHASRRRTRTAAMARASAA